MTEKTYKNSYRANTHKPYRAKQEKTEPYGLVKNLRFFRDVAFKDKRLTPMPKVLLAYMIMHCDQDGVCYISLSKLATEEDTTRQAIQNRLNRLLKYGYIIREECFSRNGRQKPNTYRLNFSLLDKTDYSELPEVSCTPATSKDCPSATPEDCTTAISGSCTKKPFKIPDKNYSGSELKQILADVRKLALDGLPAHEAADTFLEFSNAAKALYSEEEQTLFIIEKFVAFGSARGCKMAKFEKLFR